MTAMACFRATHLAEDPVRGKKPHSHAFGSVTAFNERKQSKRMTRPGQEFAKSYASSGGHAFVAVVQSANLRDFHDPTHRRRLNRSTDWCVLGQRQVSPGSFVVVEVGPEVAPQTGFIQNDRMIQTLAADRPDQTQPMATAGALEDQELMPEGKISVCSAARVRQACRIEENSEKMIVNMASVTLAYAVQTQLVQ
jgi:peptidyl-tRNA hydrolase